MLTSFSVWTLECWHSLVHEYFSVGYFSGCILVLPSTVLESTNHTPFSKTTMVAPMFRVLPWGVRSDPGSYFSEMFEPKIQNLIILHCHYLGLPGFTAGTSDIRSCYFCLNLWNKKILSWYPRFLLWNQVKLWNGNAILWYFGSLAQTFVKNRILGRS